MVRVVKPPSFETLIEEGKSELEAVRFLEKAGYTTDQIAAKSGLPYHIVELYRRGIVPTNRHPFYEVTKYYDRIAMIRSKRGKKTVLVKLLKNPYIDFSTKVKLALGRIAEERTTGVGPSIIERALAFVSGSSEKRVRKVLIDYGDYGEAAYFLLQGRDRPTLTLGEVVASIDLLPKFRKISERMSMVVSLLENSTPNEAKYIVDLLLQKLRLGYHDSIVIEAVSEAQGIPPELVAEACAIKGIRDGLILTSKGRTFLESVRLRPGEFIRPQLAHLYDPSRVVFPCRAEWKYDGSRLQLHKWGETIRIFSRRGIEKSKTLPEIIPMVRKLNAHSCIVDSEVVAVDSKGRLLPFQYLLRRTVPRKLKEGVAEEIKLSIRAFDVLYLNGESLMGRSLRERLGFLEGIVPEEYRSTSTTCHNEVELMQFYQNALKRGLEGIIVKELSSTYEAGVRTHTWLKLKPERDTVDCVVVKALYGRGWRAGLYSSFELAVRHPTEKKLFGIGRVANLPEDYMTELSKRVNELKTGEDDEGVLVRPEIIFEVTYQEIQRTKDYVGGFALRVPKFVRLRDDKRVDEIDTLNKIKRLYELQYDRFPSKEIP